MTLPFLCFSPSNALAMFLDLPLLSKLSSQVANYCLFCGPSSVFSDLFKGCVVAWLLCWSAVLTFSPSLQPRFAEEEFYLFVAQQVYLAMISSKKCLHTCFVFLFVCCFLFYFIFFLRPWFLSGLCIIPDSVVLE